jgi:hypothetical protein
MEIISLYEFAQYYQNDKCDGSYIGTYILTSLLYMMLTFKMHPEDTEKYLTDKMKIILNDNMNRFVTDVYKCDLSLIWYLGFIIWGFYEIKNNCVKNEMNEMYYICALMIMTNNFIFFVGEFTQNYPYMIFKHSQKISYSEIVNNV